LEAFVKASTILFEKSEEKRHKLYLSKVTSDLTKKDEYSKKEGTK